MRNVETYILLFTIYSVIGWIMEVVLGIVQRKRIINRGFLIGPYCPIYGFGGVTITILLKNFINTSYTSPIDDIWISTIIIMCICGMLEYATSYLMEKLFHARWWDYHRFKFNINGRICLETLLPFSILGQIILRCTSPAFLRIINSIRDSDLHIISAIIMVTIIIDMYISYNIIHSFKNLSNEVKDDTEEITAKVKAIIEKTWRGRRLVSAFPNVNIDVIRIRVRKRVEEEKEKIENTKKQIKKIIENRKKS